MQRQIRISELKKKADELEYQRKLEEKKRWWEGVDLMFPISTLSTSSTQKVADDSMDHEIKARQTLELRYSANYSRWDEWIPADPATVLEVRPNRMNCTEFKL